MTTLDKLRGAKNIMFVNHHLAMGDAALLSPIFKTVKDNLPDTSISVLTRHYALDFVRAIPSVDDVADIESVMKTSDDNSYRLKIYKLFQLVSFFRRHGCDFIMLRNDRRIPHTKKLRLAGKLSGAGIISISPYLEKHMNKSRHIVETYYSILQDMGFNVREKGKLYISLSPDNKKFAGNYLKGKGIINTADRIIGISPTSNLKVKNWNSKNVAELCENMRGKAKVIVFTTDRNVIEEISELTKVAPVFVGRMEFGDLLGLLSFCDVFVGVDTGPTHVAAALGVPAIGLYGPTSGTIAGPYGKNCLFIQAETDCPVYNPLALFSPLETLQDCYVNDRCLRRDTNCVDAIGAEEVTEKAIWLLNANSSNNNMIPGKN
ncbi:MAG TPA: lipopolysaccharide heptosyltransferase family protein [Nitrospirae bacterium]|nr:lipopolysaccharide core heptosyltransferase RfaQ [bacterium BMS3Abin06]HDH11596.1 lipopolysaccharide heptosyltransferase family protein [Nitrospirota bacterium]HDZ02016.1 lipopolysaccharide heptosyltransferase family protein [Nitrospirota bacterium]